MAMYLEINESYSEYERKHGIFPDVLFVNNSTAAYLRENNFEFNVFEKPVKEVIMELPYLWIDNVTLKRGKNKAVSEGDKGVEVFVGGLVIRRYEGQKLKQRTLEPVYIPLNVLLFNYP
ncbi:hypothetical protein [Acinetobacter nosocomialis]|uniref:hypothetical protein n=1 Tax=Acinetobacter nosocomialis TaxID=106654 RepID=UPI00124C0201|nr:hypothetical protein [Acinetobacter nosocomialis]